MSLLDKFAVKVPAVFSMDKSKSHQLKKDRASKNPFHVDIRLEIVQGCCLMGAGRLIEVPIKIRSASVLVYSRQ